MITVISNDAISYLILGEKVQGSYILLLYVKLYRNCKVHSYVVLMHSCLDVMKLQLVDSIEIH